MWLVNAVPGSCSWGFDSCPSTRNDGPGAVCESKRRPGSPARRRSVPQRAVALSRAAVPCPGLGPHVLARSQSTGRVQGAGGCRALAPPVLFTG